MATQEIDTTRADAFQGRMGGLLNEALLSLTVSIGHRSGLYDAMAGLDAASSADIARAAGLDERYVREWLAAQVTGGIVDYDPEKGAYRLPAEHAPFVTRAGGPANMARFTPGVALFGAIEDDVLACFREGGGVPYSRAEEVFPFQAELSGPAFDAALTDGVLPLAPGLVERLREGIDVLDAGCGHGHAACLMADAFPLSRVTGWDVNEDNVAAARAEADRLQLANAAFEPRSIDTLDPGSYDLVLAFDVIHDLPHPVEALAAIHGALRPGGTLVMAEMRVSHRLEENLDNPLTPMLYAVSLFHCMTVSLAQGGEGVGTVWGRERAQQALRDAGFGPVRAAQLDADPMNDYWVATREG